MDGFSSYNQIQIKLEDQHKTTFIFSWRTFAYKNMPFILKNARKKFQRAMSYAFHDINNIVQSYLDNLSTHSRKRAYHTNHLQAIFHRYRKYSIHLNPNKCIFHVMSRRLLGFIVSKFDIMVDPLRWR